MGGAVHFLPRHFQGLLHLIGGVAHELGIVAVFRQTLLLEDLQEGREMRGQEKGTRVFLELTLTTRLSADPTTSGRDKALGSPGVRPSLRSPPLKKTGVTGNKTCDNLPLKWVHNKSQTKEATKKERI